MSHAYNTLLVAVDGSEDSSYVLERALLLANQQAERLHIIHVIEPLALAYGTDIPIDVTELQNNLAQQAKENILRLLRETNISESQIYVELGSIEKTIQAKAKELQADIIVMGSHMRGGWALIFGSTARGVLPNCNCDVLAVKIPN